MTIRTLFSTIVVILTLLGASAAEMKKGVSRLGFDTAFVESAVLTEEQIAVVADLARQCGLKSIARVYTFSIHPTRFYGIGVISHDTATGIEFTNRTVLVGYEKWQPGVRECEKILKSSSEFWVSEGGVMDSRGAIFSTPQGTFRVRLPGSTPATVAEKVVAAMQTGKLRFRDADLKKRVEEGRADLSRPVAVSSDVEGRCYVSVSLGSDLAGMGLECTLDPDGGLTVIEVNTWIP